MKLKFLLKVLFFSLLLIETSYAYIDPGSGSALISVIIGFFAALGITIKTYWYKLKSFFNFAKDKTNSSKEEKD